MNKFIIDQLREVHAEIRAIRAQSERENREFDKVERTHVEHLHAEREALLGNIFFCAS